MGLQSALIHKDLKIVTNSLITLHGLIFDLVLLALILAPILGYYFYTSYKLKKSKVSESNKKRLDRLFEEMGKKHFQENQKAKLVWEKIHLILKGLNYETPKIKSLSKYPQKSPEFIFINKNYDQLEKLILKYQSLPELKIAVSNQNHISSSKGRTHLNLV